jgi:hypothetical protein
LPDSAAMGLVGWVEPDLVDWAEWGWADSVVLDSVGLAESDWAGWEESGLADSVEWDWDSIDSAYLVGSAGPVGPGAPAGPEPMVAWDT